MKKFLVKNKFPFKISLFKRDDDIKHEIGLVLRIEKLLKLFKKKRRR